MLLAQLGNKELVLALGARFRNIAIRQLAPVLRPLDFWLGLAINPYLIFKNITNLEYFN